jgi:glutaredoxin 3
MAAPVTIYTTQLCGFCFRAKALLEKKGIDYHEIDVGMDPDRRAEMEKRANGGYTVPQIFFGDRHIGGSDELAALEASGELDKILAA